MYEKALKEVYEVLDNMDTEDLKQVSPGLLNKIYESADWNYDFKYDTTKSFKEQDLSDDSKTILAIIYMRYFASMDEKAELIDILKKNDN